MLVAGGSLRGAHAERDGARRLGRLRSGDPAHLRRPRLRAAPRAGGAARVPAPPFVDDYGAALGAADLVVSRAGGSVWEVAASGKPAILVPYPDATADHQMKNAEYFARAGGAVIVPDAEAPTGFRRWLPSSWRPGRTERSRRGDARRREAAGCRGDRE